jgi:C-terminal processing protease CtpA/Prc
MHLPARTVAILVFAASCSAVSGQLQVSPQLEPAAPAPDSERASPPPPAEPDAPEEPKGPPPTEKELENLTEQLSDDDFKTRGKAQIELTRLAKNHPEVALEAVLKKYLKADILPDELFRLQAILYDNRKSQFLKSPSGFVGIVMSPGFARGAKGEMIRAIQVGRIVPDSAAERHGLQLMDQIVSIDGNSFDSSDITSEFADYVSSKNSGDEISLTIVRNNQEIEIPLTLGQRPAELVDPRFQERIDLEFKSWLDENTARLRKKE